ncbi:hypothetical protein L596_022693 [Steinernema carpocapsae]|uniref:Uncharacterized protein n=1 Tax=Steinernema carpocapsae TaxID=34508 RepID=A0A4U5MMJ8_STECR|nr:hypothetical protein L596_022693 [Steinernema carpocapsae]
MDRTPIEFIKNVVNQFPKDAATTVSRMSELSSNWSRISQKRREKTNIETYLHLTKEGLFYNCYSGDLTTFDSRFHELFIAVISGQMDDSSKPLTDDLLNRLLAILSRQHTRHNWVLVECCDHLFEQKSTVLKRILDAIPGTKLLEIIGEFQAHRILKNSQIIKNYLWLPESLEPVVLSMIENCHSVTFSGGVQLHRQRFVDKFVEAMDKASGKTQTLDNERKELNRKWQNGFIQEWRIYGFSFHFTFP